MDSILLENSCQLINIDYVDRKGRNYNDLHFHTAHQVGSCRMSENKSSGVVDPKVSIPIVENKFNLGAGVLGGLVIGQENFSFGIFYGITTYGSRDKHLSIGLGYGFAGGQMAKSPVINISGMTRIGERGYFMSENYYIPTDSPLILLSIGGRSIINKIGLDYGLFIPISEGIGTFVAIPWLGLTIPIGNKTRNQ